MAVDKQNEAVAVKDDEVVEHERPPSHLATRVASALVLIPLALAAVWYGGFWYASLLGLVGLLMNIEWVQIVGAKGWRLAGLGVLIGFYATSFALFSEVPALLPIWGVMAFAGAAVMTLAASALKRKLLFWFGLSLFYCWTPVFALSWLRATDDGLWLVAWVLLIVWGTDIGGYFVGRSIGGAKLVPQISPNKTWSGLFGGMLLAALAGLAGAIWFQLGQPALLALAAALLAVIGQAGDIVESALKRHYGVKDSGRLIPGHGGILDRVDGLVFVAPVVAGFLVLSG